MNKVLLVLFAFLVTACSKEEEEMVVFDQELPIVKQQATYQVIEEKNITYAEGLSHDSLNSASSSVIP